MKALLTMLKIGVGVLVLALIALVIAVGVAMSSLPDFDSLKSSPNGQMIRVHAVDGTVLVSLGPSYGQWLHGNQIPQVMKDAMVSVEDRRFCEHPGVDPIGVLRSLGVRAKAGHWTQGRVDDHAAAGAQRLPQQQQEFRSQVPRGDPGARAGAQILEGPDPRTLSQQGLFRRRQPTGSMPPAANSSAMARTA